MKTVLTALFSVWVCLVSGQASAQGIEDYDPSFIPTKLRMTGFAKCGVSAAADPSWPRTHRSYRDGNGSRHDKYEHLLGSDYWKKDKRLGARFSANPHVQISLTCNESGLRRKFYNQMVASLYATAKKARGHRWGKLGRFEAPGIGEVSYFVGERKTPKGDVDVARAFALHKGRIISMMIQIGRIPGRAMRGRTVRPGDVVQLVDNDGTRYQFRVTRKAFQHPLGGLGYIRTEQENRTLIETIVRSLKG